MESGDRYAFFGVDSDTCAMTTDRTEFIGRNGALERPAAMSAATLSGASGAALDPCAAIQVPFELADGPDHAIVFQLGAGRTEVETLGLIERFDGAPAARPAPAERPQYWSPTMCHEPKNVQ